MKKLVSIALIILLLSGCKTKYEKVEFENANPTSYCFDFPYLEVKKAIILEFDSGSYGSRILDFKNTVFPITEGAEIFDKKDNKYDALLSSQSFSHSKSYIYSKNGMCLEYISTHQIHVKSASENSTCLEIITINPRIKIGIYHMFTHDLSMIGPKYISVEPSTIEEYEILYLIGKRLGQKDMPAVKYPDSSCKRTKLNYYSLFGSAD